MFRTVNLEARRCFVPPFLGDSSKCFIPPAKKIFFADVSYPPMKSDCSENVPYPHMKRRHVLFKTGRLDSNPNPLKHAFSLFKKLIDVIYRLGESQNKIAATDNVQWTLFFDPPPLDNVHFFEVRRTSLKCVCLSLCPSVTQKKYFL